MQAEALVAEEAPAVVVVNALTAEHAADIVDILNASPLDLAVEVLTLLSGEKAVEVLDIPELDRAGEILELLPEDRKRLLVNDMSPDRLADVVRDLDVAERDPLIALLTPTHRRSLDALLGYPRGSAGSMMTTAFVAVPSTLSAAETLAHVREVEPTRETIDVVYVIDPATRNLLQMVTLRRLVCAAPTALILDLAGPEEPVTVSALTDREAVARLISRHDLLAVPVVDERRHILGIVTVDDILDAIVEEGSEDAQKFGGMEAIEEPYLQIGFGHMIRKRAGWLSALFLSEMLTASAMQYFEGELEKAVVLTLFIPLIMSSGGNSGSQATSLIIRALALHDVKLRDWWRVVLREFPSGIALGFILGAIGLTRIVIWQALGFYDYGAHWLLVGATVSAALVCIVTFGSVAGSMLPFVMKRLGFDPASASAPFVATLVDVTGLVLYFSVALIMLRGTLL